MQNFHIKPSVLIPSLALVCSSLIFLASFTGDDRPKSNKEHYMVVYSLGKNWNKKKEFYDQKYFNSHSNHLSRLRKEGVIALGARYSDKGMIVIRASSLDEAKKIVNSDSAVIFKTFDAEIHAMDIFYDGCLTTQTTDTMKKVTGIGGIFFKTKDPEKMKDWYSKNLGLVTDEYGSLFEFRDADDPAKKRYLQWSPFSEKTKYFEPSQKDFMINYRVENLVELIKELKANGVQVVGEIQEFEYGKFAHILDPEGNKIELWEPVETVFTETYEGKTTH